MRPVLVLLLLVLCACAHTLASPPAPPVDRSALPSWTEQIRVREEWLTRRHALLLDMMRRHGVGMWIVVNEEFHDDPLTQFVAPPRPYAGNRDLFVFVDAGPAGLKRHAVTGFWRRRSPATSRPIATRSRGTRR